jgi:hypothetical protein
MTMDTAGVGLALDIVVAVCTVATTVCAVVSLPRIVRGLSVKKETLYGDEARERFRQIEGKLSGASVLKLPALPFGGGNIIVPRLELEKLSYNPRTMPDEWKGRTAMVRFIEKTDGTDTVRRWLL